MLSQMIDVGVPITKGKAEKHMHLDIHHTLNYMCIKQLFSYVTFLCCLHYYMFYYYY